MSGLFQLAPERQPHLMGCPHTPLSQVYQEHLMKKHPKRKSIGNSKRFEIFKRDHFICQYCGSHPPHIVLELDHITPVSKGGGNGNNNLVTSCFECNRGKAARDLSIAPKSLSEKAKEIAEKEKQLLGYQAIIQAREDRIESEAWNVLEYLGQLTEDGSAYKSQLVSVKTFIKRLGFPETIGAAEICFGKEITNRNIFKYFCGVCWNKINRSDNG